MPVLRETAFSCWRMGKRGPRRWWEGEAPSPRAVSHEEGADDPMSPLTACVLFLPLLWAPSKDELMDKSSFNYKGL